MWTNRPRENLTTKFQNNITLPVLDEIPWFKVHCKLHSKIYKKPTIISWISIMENWPLIHGRAGIVVFELQKLKTEAPHSLGWWMSEVPWLNGAPFPSNLELPWKELNGTVPWMGSTVVISCLQRVPKWWHMMKQTSQACALWRFLSKVQNEEKVFLRASEVFWFLQGVLGLYSAENVIYMLCLVLVKCV